MTYEEYHSRELLSGDKSIMWVSDKLLMIFSLGCV